MKIHVFNDTVCRPSVVVPIFGPFVYFFFLVNLRIIISSGLEKHRLANVSNKSEDVLSLSS